MDQGDGQALPAEKQELLEAVAAALKRGQFDCSEEELASAYEQIRAAHVAGALASLVRQGKVDLALMDGSCSTSPKTALRCRYSPSSRLSGVLAGIPHSGCAPITRPIGLSCGNSPLGASATPTRSLPCSFAAYIAWSARRKVAL